ncbi:uncharacterized protein F4822DRAFT_188111 [Hypoxylon trugodes]|uniref:uncharacterized protein n=1 Tax=Hypoxylon trugodes TaxID=326681 RepID=UPI0021965451|nr:uncharacterized protein F4822DRAFT_188111 [Hypoxylon trugodes]KAI1391519.1 hypothetical protein F4822DRAFT_188111 [Hypoxylon trugodes]
MLSLITLLLPLSPLAARAPSSLYPIKTRASNLPTFSLDWNDQQLCGSHTYGVYDNLDGGRARLTDCEEIAQWAYDNTGSWTVPQSLYSNYAALYTAQTCVLWVKTNSSATTVGNADIYHFINDVINGTDSDHLSQRGSMAGCGGNYNSSSVDLILSTGFIGE